MKFYKYLPKKEYISTWLDGGIIPLKLASSFYSIERDKTKTPDENQIRELKSKMSPDQFNKEYSRIVQIGNLENLTEARMNLNISGNKIILDNKVIDDGSTIYQSTMIDGYIMCFSCTLSSDIANKFDMPFVVEITDMNNLKKRINQELSLPFNEGLCEYTTSINRNVFLKGRDDKWQDEYRFFWQTDNNADQEIFVEIPKGIAKIVHY